MRSFADKNSASTSIEGMLVPKIPVIVPVAVAAVLEQVVAAVMEEVVVRRDAETVPTAQVVPESPSRKPIVPTVVADIARVETNSVASPAAENPAVDAEKVVLQNVTVIDFPLIPALARWHASK